MNYWLLKSEPATFSIDDLARRPGKRDSWTGVRNYQARNFMRSMKRGDHAFFYHSSATKQTGIAGIVKIIVEAYADPTDADSDAKRPIWSTVDVQLERKLHRLLPLAELKAQRDLAGMALLRPGNRLSVMPVSEAHWQAILQLERAGDS